MPAIAALQAAAPARLVLFSENPTVEVLAREVSEAIAEHRPDPVTVASVTVREPPTCRRRFRRSPAE